MSISINPHPFIPKGSSSYDDTAIKNELEKKAEKFSDLDDFIKIGPLNDAQILMKNFKDFDLANKVGQSINCVIKREHSDLEYIPAVLVVEDYRDKYAGWRLTFTFAFTSGYSNAQTDSEIYSPDVKGDEQVVSYLYNEDYGYIIPLGKGRLVSKSEQTVNETLQSLEEQMVKLEDLHKINEQSILQKDIKTTFIATYKETSFSEIKEALDRGDCVMARYGSELYHLIYASADNYAFANSHTQGASELTVASPSQWVYNTSRMSDSYTNAAANTYPSSYALANGLLTKQDVLKSGTNIKTINGESLLGSGNIATDPTCIVTKAAEAIKVLSEGKCPVLRREGGYYPLTKVSEGSYGIDLQFAKVDIYGIEHIHLNDSDDIIRQVLKPSTAIRSDSTNETFPTSKAVFDSFLKKVHINNPSGNELLEPNTYYVLNGTDANVRIVLHNVDPDAKQEYIIEYTAKNTHIEWPEYTAWPNRIPPPNTDGNTYQVRIINSLGTFTEFPRPIINFKMGLSLEALGELHMTWEEWVNSIYNAHSVTITDGLIMKNNKIIGIGESYVYPTDEIIPKQRYTLLEPASKNDMLVGTYNQSATSTGGATLGTAYLPSIAVDSNGNFTVTALFGNSSNSPTVSATFDGNTTLTIPGGWTHPMFGPMSDDIVFDIDFETMTLTAKSNISAGGWATITGYKLIKQ